MYIVYCVDMPTSMPTILLLLHPPDSCRDGKLYYAASAFGFWILILKIKPLLLAFNVSKFFELLAFNFFILLAFRFRIDTSKIKILVFFFFTLKYKTKPEKKPEKMKL